MTTIAITFLFCAVVALGFSTIYLVKKVKYLDHESDWRNRDFMSFNSSINGIEERIGKIEYQCEKIKKPKKTKLK